ncbi:EthD family reductase [Variovorax sp. M-6]|uniref:EthD family reductase n=1 Tax=Variovorax sp. M-6 TaxID=3233041 RepID=UPI003F961DCB
MIKVSIMYPYQPDARFDHAYYRDKHLPMVQHKMGASLIRYSIDKGVSSGAPGTPPIYVAIAHLYSESLETFHAGFGPHAAVIRDDVANYTDIAPLRQVSEVVVGQGGS